MSTETYADKCFSFVTCQLNPPAHAARYHAHAKPRPAVTISRQTGSGAMAIATILADFLQKRAPAPCGGWTVFDKNLVERVLEEHHLPKEIAKFMPEDRISSIQDMMEEVVGLHPPSWTLLRQTTETILHLADIGHVILIGRAANVITRPMKTVFHVRLVAPLEKRVEQVMANNAMNRRAATQFVEKEDQGRRRYLKRYFKTDIDDPLQYDLMVNTARVPGEEVAHMIGEAVLHWAATL